MRREIPRLVMIAACAVAVASALHAAPATQRAPLPSVGQIRRLEGQEWGQACDARDQADLLRARHEERYRSGPKYPQNDRMADADFDAVAAAYRRASAAYPGTEIDAYCRQRLAGAYQYKGDFDHALDEAKQAAELFGGTPMGIQAEHSVALIYLNALHQPGEAEPWFHRVEASAAGRLDAQDQAKWHAAAAEGLAQCQREAAAAKRKPSTRPAAGR